MDLLTVNQDKCLRCGICVECCPSCILSMGENGPECNFDRGCMSCGQCVAICPVGALDNKYTPLEKQRPVTMPVLDSATAYEFLRMRRSVRNFKPQPPTDEEITRLLDIARYAPTAGNSQGMYYIVIRDAEKIKAIADAVADWMEAEVEAGTEEILAKRPEIADLTGNTAGDSGAEQNGLQSEAEADSEQVDDRIDLNTADAALLSTLSGIGQSKAEAIIAYRQEHGGFASIEEIMNVEGIKEGTFSKIKDKISAG